MTPIRRIFALILLSGVFVMEGYDINAMALALPRLDADLPALPSSPGAGTRIVGQLFGFIHLWPPSFGLVFTALLVGIGIGGAILAPYGDKFGRRTMIVAGCIATGACTLATSRSETIAGFLLWRALTGISLGAALPNVSALSAELAPDRLRATIMSAVSAGIPLGLAVAGILAPEVIAAGGWQGLFLVPGTFAIFLAGTLWLLLEGGSPSPAGSAEPVARGEPTTRRAGGLVARLYGWAENVPQLRVFLPPWLVPFAIFVAMLSLNAMNLYLLNSWIPTVLPMAGFSLDNAARVSGIVQFAGLAIGIAASFGLDRWRPATTLALMFGAMTACFVAVSLTAPQPLLWTLLLMVGVGGTSAGGMVLPALCVHLFSARLLSSSIGMGVLVARIGAAFGPLLGQWIIDSHAGPQVFFLAAAAPAAACAAFALLVPLALKAKQCEDAEAVLAATA